MEYICHCVLLFALFIIQRCAANYCNQNYGCYKVCYRIDRYTTSCGFAGWSRCTRYRPYAYSCLSTCGRQICCEGYTGERCETPICFGSASPFCQNGGRCIGPDNCLCPTGFSGADCSIGVNDTSCGRAQIECDHECSYSGGSYSCTCFPGYELQQDSRSCKDVDECKGETNDCDQICTNTNGSYVCACNGQMTLGNDQKTCLGSNIEPPQPTKVKKLGLTGSASSEFAKRFMTKPTRQPKVIDFNAGNVQVDKKRRGINGFFPPMKLRNSAKEVKSNSNGENKANDEHNDLGLCIDSSVTKQNVDKHEEKTTESLKLPEINTKEPTETQVELTQNNLRKQFPKHISIPIVEETETIESNSTRALDSSIQFKLPPVILSAVSDGDQKKLGTKERCTACNNRDQTTHFPNIWLIHEDFDTSDLQYEDFTNAILGHFPTSNFRLRRELTIYWDRHPGSKRFFELHVPAIETENYPGAPLEKSNTDSSLMLRQNLGRYKVDAMKYMTREVYTNLKLSKSITRAKEDRLQLVPTSYSEVRPRSNTSRAVSRSSRRSVGARKTPESVRTVPPNPTENYLPYADTFDCDDLSYLPPPKRILPRRDAPWVFRYKVKKNMNTLSKILASKPQQAIENV